MASRNICLANPQANRDTLDSCRKIPVRRTNVPVAVSMRSITHDGSGIIHCELPWGDVTPNLGEFFTIWGQPLPSGGAWIESGSVSAKVVDMDAHTTTDYSSNPASIPFDHPAGGPYSNPYSIPQNLIFYGQYGNGQSSGFFAGEVVYLNITA